MTLTAERRTFSRARLLEYIDGLEKTATGPYRSFYLAPDVSDKELHTLLQNTSIPADTITEVVKYGSNSATGAILFLSNKILSLILPPFPVSERLFADTFETGPLRSMLNQDYCIGLVLVRLGSYGIGACQGEKLVSSKVGTGLVHRRHRKGGSSAHRFERHRDKQIEYFLTRVCQHALEKLEPYVKSLDFLVYGGARTTIHLLQKQCPFLARLDVPYLPPLYDIAEPRQAVLEDAVRRVWSGTVIEWKEV